MPDQTPKDTFVSRPLAAWNPADQIRLLWWCLVLPDRLRAYREYYGEGSQQQTGAWLASTLTWLPALLISIAAVTRILPVGASDLAPADFLWSGPALIVAWALTGWLSSRAEKTMGCSASFVALNALVLLTLVLFTTRRMTQDAAAGEQSVTPAMIALAIAFAIAVLPAHLVPGGVPQFVAAAGAACAATITGGFLGFVAAFFTTSLLSYPLQRVVEKSHQSGNPSRLARGALGATVFAYAIFIWFCFLGGWQVFK